MSDSADVLKRLDALEGQNARLLNVLEELLQAQAAAPRRSNPGTPPMDAVWKDVREDNREMMRALLQRNDKPAGGMSDTMEALRVMHELTKPNPTVEVIDALCESVPAAIGGLGDSVGEAVKLFANFKRLQRMRAGGEPEGA